MKLNLFRELHHSDRRIIACLLAAALLFFALSQTDWQLSDVKTEQGEGVARADSLNPPATYRADAAGNQQQYYHVPAKVAKEQFPFDPNTADSTQLLRLGLQPWQVRNIYKYRAAGGIYRTKEDFAQLYGLTVQDYRRLEPYIRISADYLPASTLTTKPDSMPRPMKLSKGQTIDLNTSDTAMLKTVPGVGSYYARRIADYRHRLGGFVSVDQLDDIENLPAEVKPFFTVGTGIATRKLPINRLSLKELKAHPYLNYYQARAIVDYRRVKGPIADLAELSLLPEFPQWAIDRLRPYVSYEE